MPFDQLPTGHTIPYAYTQSEIQEFFNLYSTDPTVSNYLWTKQPAYGVVFTPSDQNVQLLLWFDASGTFHVIDVTNTSIAAQVQQPPYESPDSSIVQNVYDQVQSLIDKLPSPTQALGAVEIVAAAAGLYFLSRMLSSK